jgi:dTDP-4-amino-4,6-dideoxygalactose transaminase
MIPVPGLDLAATHRALADEIEPAVLAVLRSGHYILGPVVEAFEDAFAAYVDARHCIGVANGLDALRLSLEALGIGPGDEVIVPSHTYIATWFAVSAAGARPVPVEVDEATFVLDPARVEDAIGPRTRAILAVHLYGHPAPMTQLLEIAARHDLRVVEDAAQAQGARLGGRAVGTLGDAAGWSFYPVKNLGAAGDAGAITTNDDDLARRLRLARNQGSIRRSVHEIVGANSRLDPIQAAILTVKLRHLEVWNARRREIAARYLAGLAGTAVILPRVAPGSDHVWHQFVVRHDDRDGLRAALTGAGIETLVHYETPPHRQAAYAELGLAAGSLPIAERLASTILSLPMDPLLTDAAIDAVIETARTWDRDRSARRTSRWSVWLASRVTRLAAESASAARS